MNNCVPSNETVLPQIGFGTADLSGSVDELVYAAISAGFRLIDTAQVYGSEKGIGQAIRRAVTEKLVGREEIFVETKLAPQNGGYYEALAGVEQSLNELQLDYIDMFLIHWPVPRGDENNYREKNKGTWQAFQEMKTKGVIRNIGVCNFLERHLLYLTEDGGEFPQINQLELHPGFQQRGLVQFCRERGMKIEAWSPMGRGILKKDEYVEMAAKYSKDIGQLALRWSIQKGFIPLTRSSTFEHIIHNIDIFDFEISQEDMEQIDQLNSSDNHQDIWSYRRQMMY